ncbi:MAG: VPLPA-CTERM-specific exosortase XrtD [Pseudomonadota bacterium]
MQLKPFWIAAGAFLIVLALAHYGGLASLARRWSNQEEYSHGFFIPLLSAWIIWNRRDAVRETLGHGSMFGFVVLAGSVFTLIIGELSALFLLVQVSFITSLAAFALIIGGWKLLRICLFPILFLFFAIPLPYFIDATLSWRLQLLSSQWGVLFLRIFNVPVFLEGNVIDLGLYQLQVVDACSGLRYLYPLMSLGILGAYLYKAAFWQRAVIFLSTIPITIVMNSIRIGMIGILVNQYGIEMAEGALHFFEGWIIFMTCAVLLFGEIWLLNKLTHGDDVFDRIGFPQVSAARTSGLENVSLVPALGATAVVLLTIFGLQAIGGREEEIPDRRQLAQFPLYLEGWRAREQTLDPEVEQALKVDDYLLADYGQRQNQPVNFYVAFYESQRKGASPHSPRVCIPGGGWEISNFSRAAMKLPETKSTLPFNRLIISNNSDKLLVYYWFDQRGKKFANEYLMKAHLLKDAVTINRTDGALVRVTTPINAGEGLERADERLQSFIRTVTPYLPQYIPGTEL